MKKEVFINNRNKVISKMENNSILICFSLINDEDYFVVNKNFYYLTGDNEKSDILVIEKNNNIVNEYMFIKAPNEFEEKWTGKTYNKNQIYEFSGISNIYYLEEYDSIINSLLNRYTNVYLDLNKPEFKKELSYEETIKATLKNKNVLDFTPLIKSARTIKQKEEIIEFKKAIDITNKGIIAILDNLRPGIYEYQIESYFDQAIKYNGANGYSFPTIAASGKNGACLHYSANNTIMKDNDLILFDLGATYNYYCADISRTFPISGKFTERQKLFYNIVLEAQKRVFEFYKPGVTTKEANELVIKFYQEKLLEIGLIKNKEEVSKYYYHGVSHHIGLDCHDLCDYTPLKPGCIVSVEPGLYIKEEGIGIRIEDDALITEDGCINLSEHIIKSVDEIEKYMSNRNKK